jgi:hypothetical protein
VNRIGMHSIHYSTMSQLNVFVDDIQTRLAALSEHELRGSQPQAERATVQALTLLDVGNLSTRFASLLGSEHVEAFFRCYEPTTVDGIFHLFQILWQLLAFAIEESSDGRISVNSSVLLKDLSRLARAVEEGTFDYTIALRLTNIDIAVAFDLAPGIHFHKLPLDEFSSKYPFDRHSPDGFWLDAAARCR